jgi:eukaryotic-like serine/threonine-protein kinase
MIGKTLGHYQIADQLGKGGMGEVYKAKDQKLGRDVAIKVLPDEFARDADRVARFQREAKALASLNHPNIAAIYGLEEFNGTNFLVLELVEGLTLADRIKAGPIPVEEALKLAVQIADALEAAHEKGIIHRDLKPANINVTPEGKAKVLDFGLAKAFAGEATEVNLSNSPTLTYSPTLSDAATRQGVILGTAAYMSPEQARGKSVDKRADIWAFGCILFEMLTGKAAFPGKDVTDILAAVIRSEPEWNSLPANLHWRLRETVESCLKKNAADRCHDIADVRLGIQKVLADPSCVSMPGIPIDHRTKLHTILPWVSASIVLTAMIAAWAVWKLKPPELRGVERHQYSLPEGQQLKNSVGNILAVSPDGRQYVYVTAEGLYLRSLSEFNAKLIDGTGTSPATPYPFFSHDGKWLAYVADSKLKKIAITGGAPDTLCDVSAFTGGSWGADNRIVYADKGIYRVSANGGTPELIVKETGWYPQLLPGGKSLLVTSGPPPYKIFLQSLQSGKRTELFPGDKAQYISTGHIVYARGSKLFAMPFDLKTQKVTGDPVPVVEDVWRALSIYTPQYAVSDTGTLVYIPATTAIAQRTLVWVDRKGKEEPLGAPLHHYHNPRISPDGTRVALAVADDPNKEDIFIWDLIHSILTMLKSEGDNISPVWIRDGKQLAFFSNRERKYLTLLRSADGAGKDEVLGEAFVPAFWVDIRNTLVGTTWHMGYVSGIGALSIEGDHKPSYLLNEKYHESHPRISPNGRWMVYTSIESGRDEIYIRSFPNVDTERRKISRDGGNSPLWSKDEIFYRNGDSVMTVAVKTSPTLSFEPTKTLFQGTYVSSVNSPGNDDFATWDISPDGKKFLMMKEQSAGSGPRKINIVLNWLEELKQRVLVK